MRSFARVRLAVLVFVSVLLAPSPRLHAQEVHAAPGQYDYYLLNLSWAPEFCHNLQALPNTERFNARREDAAAECSMPTGFVLHGLWPQNFAGTWPANCGTRPGPASYTPYLTDTPSLTLLQHEWSKHGTCTTLAPDAFFTAADKAFHAVHIPNQLQNVSRPLQLRPADILGAFYQANPSWPQGSAALSCGHNYLTAVEVCLSKSTMQPIACQGLHTCGATEISVAPPDQTQPATHGTMLRQRRQHR